MLLIEQEAVVGDDVGDVALEQALRHAQVQRQVVAGGVAAAVQVDGDVGGAEDEQREQDAGDPPASRPSPAAGRRVSLRASSGVAARSSAAWHGGRAIDVTAFGRVRSTAARRSATFSALNIVRCHARLVARLGLPGVVVVGDRRVRRADLADAGLVVADDVGGEAPGEREQLVVGDDVVDEPEVRAPPRRRGSCR